MTLVITQQYPGEIMLDEVVDDIWADEVGVSIRFTKTPENGLKIGFTSEGPNSEITHQYTLSSWRVKRLIGALHNYYGAK